ncbi:MAG: trypsin-like peptidase domain-containing protein [Akkermansiaceae bacterium]
MVRLVMRCVLLMVTCCLYSTSAHGEIKKEIVDRVAPGVVVISDSVVHGSGIVLDSSGKILCCNHTVSGFLPLKVEAMVQLNGVRKMVVFDEVEVLQQHPVEDLAIVKVKLPRGGRLVMPPMRKTLPEVNSECALICRPIGVTVTKEKNGVYVSEGKIVDLEYKVKFIDATAPATRYIKTSAVANLADFPGGALVNDDGEVAGIVAYGYLMNSVEGIAIPLEDIEMGDFVEVGKRTPNKQNGQRAYHRATTIYNGKPRPEEIGGLGKDDAAVDDIEKSFRVAQVEAPTSSGAFVGQAAISMAHKDFDIAEKYYLKALELEKTENYTIKKIIYDLGLLYQEKGDVEKAREMWKQGMQGEKLSDYSHDCARELARLEMKAGNYSVAAYLTVWSWDIAKRVNRLNEKIPRAEYEEVLKQLPKNMVQFISNKHENFSYEDMEVFLGGIFEKKKGLDKKIFEKLHAVRGSKLFKSEMSNAVVPDELGTFVDLPGECYSSCSAYGGMYIVMTFPNVEKIGVFSVPRMKFVKMLPLPSPSARVTSGGNKLVVTDVESSRFYIYDLNTFKRVTWKSKPFEKLLGFEMTSSISDRGVVSWVDRDKKLHVGYMKIPGCQIAEVEIKSADMTREIESLSRQGIAIKVNYDLTRFLLFTDRYGTKVYGELVDEEFDLSVLSLHDSGLDFGLDPTMMITGKGKFISNKGVERRDSIPASVKRQVDRGSDIPGGQMLTVYPSVKWAATVEGANQIVAEHDEMVVVYDVETRAKLGESKPIFDHFGGDVHASSHTGRVVMISKRATKVGVMVLPKEGGE